MLAANVPSARRTRTARLPPGSAAYTASASETSESSRASTVSIISRTCPTQSSACSRLSSTAKAWSASPWSARTTVSSTPTATTARVSARRSRRRSARGIALAAHGADQRGEARVLELAAQPVHVGVDDVPAGREAQPPHLAQQLAAADGVPSGAQQRGEERELGPREVEAILADVRVAAQQVELERAHHEACRLGRRAAAERAHARRQLGERERLDQ